ncbi:TrmB family transcriptional regulator [Candidatus Woesearchaeota archaeon]|nr:TrmB family transcriptional regulator [Candidatus Woesearchaeota archaeon]
MDTKPLEDLGLTNAEIRIYLALLELGTATAGPILDKTGLQNSVVHLTLNKLVEKGFVTFVKEGKVNHYQAANPKHIINFINEKKQRFEDILPELLLKQKYTKEKPEIIAFRGIKGIKELLLELLDAGGNEHNTFGSTVKSLMLGDVWWVEYHAMRAKKGIAAKLIFNESLKEWCDTNKYPAAEYKFTKAGFEPLTETIIRNDKIGIIVWTDKPLGIIIHQKEAAESYDKFFQMMWGMGEK